MRGMLLLDQVVENLSSFVPSRIEDIERTIQEKGLIEIRPVIELPLKK